MTEPVTPPVEETPDDELVTTDTIHHDDNGDEVETVDTKFYNQHETKQGRLPSNVGYLDEMEAEQAEILRADHEGRDADLENPPAVAGQPLVPAEQLPETSLTSTASALDDDQSAVLVEPAVTLPVAVDPAATSEQDSDAAAADNSEAADDVDMTHANQTADEDAARGDGIVTPTNTAETTDQSTVSDQANGVVASTGPGTATPWANDTPVETDPAPVSDGTSPDEIAEPSVTVPEVTVPVNDPAADPEAQGA